MTPALRRAIQGLADCRMRLENAKGARMLTPIGDPKWTAICEAVLLAQAELEHRAREVTMAAGELLEEEDARG